MLSFKDLKIKTLSYKATKKIKKKAILQKTNNEKIEKITKILQSYNNKKQCYIINDLYLFLSK